MQGNDINLYEVRTLCELENIRESWNQLLINIPTATPFQTWEWNFGMATFEENRVRLRVVVAKNLRGEVVGIAPFCIHSNGLPGLRVLEFVGGRASDYLDLFALQRYKNIFVQLVLEWIERNKGWNILNFRNLRRESVALICKNDGFEMKPSAICRYANLPPTFQEYERKVLQKRLRKTIRHHLNLLGGQKRLAFSTSWTDSNLPNALALLFDLHQRRQGSKGERGRFFCQRWRHVFQEMSLALLQAGYLRLGILWVDGKPAACSYNLRLRDREYLYSGGMEPSLARYSPGSLLDHWMIGEALKEGVRVYDFMEGNDPYKSRWTNETCQLYEITRARSGAAALIWRNFESWRSLAYRIPLVKRVYFATMGLIPPRRARGSRVEARCRF